MKNVVSFITLTIGLFIFTSCMSDSTTPEQAAIESVTYMIEGKYDKLADMLVLPESIKGNEAETKKFKEDKIKYFEVLRGDKCIHEDININGGLDKVFAAKNSDGTTVKYRNDEKTTATVWVQIICKNGDTLNSGHTPLAKQDGKWRLDID